MPAENMVGHHTARFMKKILLLIAILQKITQMTITLIKEVYEKQIFTTVQNPYRQGF